ARTSHAYHCTLRLQLDHCLRSKRQTPTARPLFPPWPRFCLFQGSYEQSLVFMMRLGSDSGRLGMPSLLPETLRDQVRLLGDQLGTTILEHHGPQLFRKIEEIRNLSKTLAQQAEDASVDYQPLIAALGRLPDADVL